MLLLQLLTLELVARMSPLPIWAQFHQSMHIVPLGVHVPTVPPSPVCAALASSGDSPSTLKTPSLFHPSSFFLSTSVRSSCRVIASSPLLLEVLSTQVGQL